jgi:tRNA-2-methylthio-N6-dimethylallyladenosine synthase
MVGVGKADKTGKIMARLRERMPGVEFVETKEFTNLRIYESTNNNHAGKREKIKDKGESDDKIAYVIISNGCNNFCTYCVVPFARGREVSRLWEEIISECAKLKERGVKSVMLLGQNVNSYGSDLVRTINSKLKVQSAKPQLKTQNYLKPVMVKHLGRYRIPTLFPQLLETVAKMGFENINFMSSNPWDFSDELIDVIARNKNISRTIHLPVQSGDDSVLKRMNRWYTAREYLALIKKLKIKNKNLKLTTDIIVGFPGETEEQFQHTVDLCRKVKFDKAYISLYSPRPLTAASKNFPDDVPHAVKKKRWEVLDKMINKKGE